MNLHITYIIYYLVLLIVLLIFSKAIKTIIELFFKSKEIRNIPLINILPYSNIEIIDDIACLVSKNNTYSIFIKFLGFPYYANVDQEAQLNNISLLNKFVMQYSKDYPINIKIIFVRDKDIEGYKNEYYFEINSKHIDLVISVAQQLKNTLHIYKGRFLNTEEILNLQYYLINKQDNKLKLNRDATHLNLCNYVANSEITISNKLNCGEIFKSNQSIYFKSFLIILGNEITPEIIQELLKINGTLEVICNLTLLDKNLALKILQEDKTTLLLSGSKFLRSLARISNKTLDENDIVQEAINNNEEGLLTLEIFILISATSIEQLLILQNTIEQRISKYYIEAREERYLGIYVFLKRLAGFQVKNKIHLTTKIDQQVMYQKVVGSVLASMISMPELPTGFTSNDWGNKPLTTFRTNYNNVYNFNLHKNNQPNVLAHSLIIASSGGGKTTIFEHLMHQALQNYDNLAVYSFDSFNGMTIFTDYVGGQNIDFENVGINPFQIDLNDDDNYRFAINLLKMMTGFTNEEEIKKIVDALATLPPEERILANEKGTSYPSNGEVYQALSDWTEGTYAQYFNAPKDNLSLDNKFTNFQMNRIIRDERLSAPIIYYIMHKIEKQCKSGSPHFVFLDEAAALINNRVFAEEIKRMLNQHRKLRGSINLAFQSPDVFLDLPEYQEKILNNMENIMLLENTPLTNERAIQLNIPINQLLDFFNLANKNRFSNENARWMLVKKSNGDTIFLDVNLTDKLGKDIVFYNSSSNEVERYKGLKQKYGNNWQEPFKNGEIAQINEYGGVENV